jgi:hypothetical protein
MTRIGGTTAKKIDLEDDEWVKGSLSKPTNGWLQDVKKEYAKSEGEKQLVVVWMTKHGDPADFIRLTVNQTAAGEPSKLARLLNALCGKPADTEVWFDDRTLEWGYYPVPQEHMTDDEINALPPYARLTEGMEVMFTGVNRQTNGKPRYRITGYKAVKSNK